MVFASKIYKIGNSAIPSPSQANVEISDLETDAYRDASGVTHRDRARQGVRKINFSYDLLTQEETEKLLPMLNGVFVDITYQDPEFGKHKIECYCSTKSMNLYTSVGDQILWQNVTFNCVQR